jgi:AraC-like DNA-binding protein
MPLTPTIDRGIVTSIVATFDAFQADLQNVVEFSGLAESWTDPDIKELPEDRVWRLFELGARSLDLPDIGLRVGSEFQIRDLGEFGRKLESSLTVFSCLSDYIKTVNRYSSHSRFWLEVQDTGVWFHRQGIDLIEVGRDEVEQFTLQLMIRLVQLAWGPTWMPTRITIQQSSDRFFRDCFGSDDIQIKCGQSSTAIWITTEELLNRVPWHDDAIIECIRETITVGSDGRKPTITAAARQLGFSVRTVQRELALHGLDWSRLLDQIRLSRAVRLLSTPIPLAEIAEDLGYNDQANFGRAFRRWTGVTPRCYRTLVADSKAH